MELTQQQGPFERAWFLGPTMVSSPSRVLGPRVELTQQGGPGPI